MILQKIIEQKKKELVDIKGFDNLEPSTRNFKACLKGKNNIIAEIKRRSPSEGKIKDCNVVEIAKIYDKYANAISIVTDKEFFGGDIGDIKRVKQVTSLPVLRKDFIIDKKQILESRYYGADAILLIASILTKEQIDEFIGLAKQYSMDCLVEVHTKEEIEKVLETKAKIIGINNRNLKTFKVDLNKTNELKKLIPTDKIVVSESGFSDIEQIKSVDTNAVLIGTSLMKSDNAYYRLFLLRKPKTKICGITNTRDANEAVKQGADFLGFNFYKKSPRYIEPEEAKKIIAKLPNTVVAVGVFVNEKAERVNKIAQSVGLDMLQLHGDESPKYCKSFSLPVIKAFHVDKSLPQIKEYNVFGYLFDTFDKKLYGGTGRCFDASIVKDVNSKVFISGGLNCENVLEAINSVNPYCVDVCSGVEKEKGKKDKKKMKMFIQEVIDNAN